LDRSLWTRLNSATSAARFGHKAANLARLTEAGLPVVEGWALESDTAARVLDDPDLARTAATQLIRMAPTRQWILRSSSPLEDRPGRSAAGWFETATAPASVDEIARALRRVVRSSRDPRLVRQLGEPPPLAVLAQRQLKLELWCTAEFREGAVDYEGWDESRRRWTARSSEMFDELVHSAAQSAGFDPALLELGSEQNRPWLLQIRPAPSRVPPTAAERGPIRQFEGLGTEVHPGDADRTWKPDLEHCPTPLSVLLATTFGRWIAADPDHTPSRLRHGRWFDAAGRPEPADRRRAHSEWERWRRQLGERVQPALSNLARREASLEPDPRSWRRFHESWFALQSAYFAMPGSGARAWARTQLAQGRAPLTPTPAAGRIQRWSELRERLFAHPDPPVASAEGISAWVLSHAADPLASDLQSTARRDRAVAPLPYDGFTPGLDEDPWPFYRSLAHGLPQPEPLEVRDPDDELAAAILALAETDNELLLEAYALWRAAVRRIADRRDVEPPTDLHMLDIETFEQWLESGEDFPVEAARRGRALHAAWSVADSGEGGPDDTATGIAAAGGTARGPAQPGRSLLELETDGGIAVVDTLGPADAIAVPRFAGVVCSAGDLLGHASVLCREFGIPCVVGVTGARQRLAHAFELFVDGDHGVVRVSS
jgi:phosphohistidine swiveling domain-containing protein